MLFTDSIFLFYFLPIVLVLHRFISRSLIGKHYGGAAAVFGVCATFVFYGFKEPWWLLPFMVSIFFDFVWARALYRSKSEVTRKWVLAMSVVQNLALLGVFKYWNFIAESLAPFVGIEIPRVSLGDVPTILPAGISFYTFESMSFVIDVYRREIIPPKNPLDFFSFIAMFPRFIAGPIVRYRDLAPQLERYEGMNLDRGLSLFIKGFFLKTCFADSCALFVSYAFHGGTPIEFYAAWLGAFAYTLQIYFDFSGYSLMAIGLGKCLGFRFNDNFDRPYLAKSLTDFWHRWHISLSTWLRDYLYISLGGNRVSPVRTNVNLLLTMMVGGLWHGANWTFLAWGTWHGLGLMAERLFSKNRSGFLSGTRTFLFVVIGWVLFRADSFAQARQVLSGMFHFESALRPWDFNFEGIRTHSFSFFFLVCGVIYLFGFQERLPTHWLERPTNWVWHLSFRLAVLGTGILVAFSAGRIPFLYFQF